MSKFKKIEHRIKKIKDDSTDKYLFEIIKDILEDEELKEVSGIIRNNFAVQTRDYFEKYKRFTDKQRAGLISTLEVYKDNLDRAKLV